MIGVTPLTPAKATPALSPVLGGTTPAAAPVKKAKAPKLKFGWFAYDMSKLPGLDSLDGLTIGELTGTGFYSATPKNSFYFTPGKWDRGHWKPEDRIAEYDGLLREKFDIIVSLWYNADHMKYLKGDGIYITQVKDGTMLPKGMFDKDTATAVFSKTITFKKTHNSFDFLVALKDKIKGLIAGAKGRDPKKAVYLPNIDKIFNEKPDNKVTLTHKGIKVSKSAAGLLALYNETLHVYNPVFTTYTGIMDAYHKFPATAFVNMDKRVDVLEELGFKVKVEPTARVKADRLSQKYDFLTTPLMPLLPQQTLAYVKEGEYKAKGDVPRLGIKKRHSYDVRVGWQKRRDGDIKRGFFTLRVNGHTLFEDSNDDVTDFITAFGLPQVDSIEGKYPGVVELWTKKARKMFPQMKEWQVEDVALLATKPNGYLGSDRGTGKTYVSAAWAKLREYKRVLVCAQAQYLDKWASELEKFGFKYEKLLDWQSVNALKAKIRAGIKNPETVFYLTSFEFIGHEDVKMLPWDCVEKSSDGCITAVYKGITGRNCPGCGKTVGQARKLCPSCGSSEFTGRYCLSCKEASFTYTREKPLTPARCADIESRAKEGRRDFSNGQYPAFKRIKKLFPCVMVDEAQMIKNKNSLRSQATRGLRAKGRMLITANLMKNYPNELFWTCGWALGFNTPLFPYQYHGGFSFFEEQFGTKILKGETPEGKEMWKRTPEVSNLSIMWKLMSPFMVRRLKADIEGIPEKIIHPPVVLEMDEKHKALYGDVLHSKLSTLAEELQKENPDIHIIGANLWSLRAASTVPNASRYFSFSDASYEGISCKMQWIIEKCVEVKAKNEKIVLFSTLIDMQALIYKVLSAAGIKTLYIKQGTKNRFDVINTFNEDDTTALVSSGELIGKSYDVLAENVVVVDMGFTPEEVEQEMDRCNRLVSTKPLNVWILLNRGTICTDMYELVMAKGEAIKNVLDRRAVYETAEVIREANQEANQIKVARRLLKAGKEAANAAPSAAVLLPVPPAPVGIVVLPKTEELDVWANMPPPSWKPEQCLLFAA
jgi:hypothetical protein